MKHTDELLIANQQWLRAKVKGKSFVYNQLVENGNFENTSGVLQYRGTISVSNNTLKYILGDTTSSAYVGFDVPHINTHKYLLTFDIKCSVNSTINVLMAGSVWKYGVPVSTNFEKKGIFATSTGATSNYFFLYVAPIGSGNSIEVKKFQIFDITDLENYYGVTINTLEDFYTLLECGKQVKNGVYLPYSATNAIYEADLSEATFKNDDGTQTQKVSILQNGQPLKLGGIGTAKDYYLNVSGKVNRVIGNVDLGSLVWQYDSVYIRFYATFQLWKTYSNWATTPVKILCSKYTTEAFNSMELKDKCIAYYSGYRLYAKDTDYTNATTFKNSLAGVKLIFELATPTTEITPSIMIHNYATKITDANGVELEYDILK